MPASLIFASISNLEPTEKAKYTFLINHIEHCQIFHL